MKLVKFTILGDENYRKTGVHPARLVDPATDEVVMEFAVNSSQLLKELVDEGLISKVDSNES